MGILRAGNREWFLYVFVGAVLIALCLAIVYLEPAQPTAAPATNSTSAGAATSADAVEKQAAWSIRIHPAGVTGRLNKRSKAQLAIQRKELRGLIRETYDALFLDPSQLRDVVGKCFAAQAARAFLRSKAGLPKGADSLKTTIRRARIGIQATNARHAAGQVVVMGRARTDGSIIRIRHRSTLWLQRQSKGWKVVAFEIDQKRVR